MPAIAPCQINLAPVIYFAILCTCPLQFSAGFFLHYIAFALTVENMPAIALFNYSSEGYALLELRQGEREGVISIEEDGYLFIYINERYQGEMVTIHLKNGEGYKFNIEQNKGRLIVEK